MDYGEGTEQKGRAGAGAGARAGDGEIEREQLRVKVREAGETDDRNFGKREGDPRSSSIECLW
jgi:hypothetical protein